MKTCQVHQLEVKQLDRKMLKVQEVSEQQKKWLQALDAETLIQDHYKKELLKHFEMVL